jgi:hypothetical protein
VAFLLALLATFEFRARTPMEFQQAGSSSTQAVPARTAP